MNDDDDDIFLSIDEQSNIIARCEQMFILQNELYFDVHEYEFAIDFFMDQTDFDKALTLVLIASKQHPLSSEIKLRKAKVYLSKGKPNKALQIITSLSETSAEQHEIESITGFCLIETNNLQEAEIHFDKAIIAASDDMDISYYIATNLINKEQFSLAIKYLEQTYLTDNTNPFAIYDLAFCYEKTDQLEMSVIFYKKFIDIDPYSDNAWYNLGILYNRLEEYQDAISSFDYALAINEKNAMALFNKANTYANWTQYETAIELYNEFLNFEKDNVVALYYIGECHEKLEQYKDAKNYYLTTLSIDPLFSEAWHGLGVVAFYEQNLIEACQMTEKAIELDADNSEFWFSFGNINKSIKGNEQKALYCYQRATELEPYDAEFWLNFAEMEKITSNTEKAAKTLESAYNILEDDAELDFVLSAYYYELGNKIRSIELFNKARGLDVEMATAFFSNCTLMDEDKKIYTTIITH
jgi:tetratricopeptide (TPR) repeat protein